MVNTAGSVASTQSNAALSVVDFLRTDSGIHSGIISRMQLGVSRADSNVFEYAPACATNYLRWLHMNDELGKFFVEHEFTVEKHGFQLTHEKECLVTPTLVKIVLARGNRMDFDNRIVFAANPKSNAMAINVAENHKHSGFVNSLFDMEDLESLRKYFFGSTYDDGPAVTTVFIFWEPSPRLDIFEDETIKVFLAKPVSIDKTRTQIEVQWADEVGSFSTTGSSYMDVSPIDLPVAPSYEPSIVPRTEGENVTL